MTKPAISTETLLSLYGELGTLDKVAARVGLNRATIHERLKRAGYTARNTNPVTPAQREIIRAYYTETPPNLFDLDALAAKLGRLKSNVSRTAREMGLTNLRRPMSAEGCKNLKKSKVGQWDGRAHPRGALGMKHTDETKAVMSRKSKLAWATSKAFGIGHMAPEALDRKGLASSLRMSQRPAESVYSRAKAGRRADIGETWFRSSWEANYARYLNLLMKMRVVESWAYEPETFWFHAILRGVRSYKPDFRVMYRNDPRPVYVEVKGWFDDKSKTKLKRMKKYHPDVRIELVAEKEYRALQAKWKGAIPTWE